MSTKSWLERYWVFLICCYKTNFVIETVDTIFLFSLTFIRSLFRIWYLLNKCLLGLVVLSSNIITILSSSQQILYIQLITYWFNEQSFISYRQIWKDLSSFLTVVLSRIVYGISSFRNEYPINWEDVVDGLEWRSRWNDREVLEEIETSEGSISSIRMLSTSRISVGDDEDAEIVELSILRMRYWYIKQKIRIFEYLFYLTTNRTWRTLSQTPPPSWFSTPSYLYLLSISVLVRLQRYRGPGVVPLERRELLYRTTVPLVRLVRLCCLRTLPSIQFWIGYKMIKINKTTRKNCQQVNSSISVPPMSSRNSQTIVDTSRRMWLICVTECTADKISRKELFKVHEVSESTDYRILVSKMTRHSEHIHNRDRKRVLTSYECDVIETVENVWFQYVTISYYVITRIIRLNNKSERTIRKNMTEHDMNIFMTQ